MTTKKAPAAKQVKPKPTAPEPRPTVPGGGAAPTVPNNVIVAVVNESDALRARVAELESWVEKTVKTATIDYATAHTLLKR